jgi:hypothetical protein
VRLVKAKVVIQEATVAANFVEMLVLVKTIFVLIVVMNLTEKVLEAVHTPAPAPELNVHQPCMGYLRATLHCCNMLYNVQMIPCLSGTHRKAFICNGDGKELQ